MNYRRFRFVRDVIRFMPAVLALGTGSAAAQTDSTAPVPCVIRLSETTSHYQPLLSGPPQTAGMESGLVILMPGASGSQHSSKGYEEALVVLSGEGEMAVSGGPTLKLKRNSVAYCPTQTVHQIRNSGTEPLKYVYVAARVTR